MSYTFLVSIFALIVLALQILFSAVLTEKQNESPALVFRAIPNSHPNVWRESGLQGLILQLLLAELSQQEGIGWQKKYLPRRSLPGEGPLCPVVKDNGSIKRLRAGAGGKAGRGGDCPHCCCPLQSPPKLCEAAACGQHAEQGYTKFLPLRNYGFFDYC